MCTQGPASVNCPPGEGSVDAETRLIGFFSAHQAPGGEMCEVLPRLSRARLPLPDLFFLDSDV